MNFSAILAKLLWRTMLVLLLFGLFLFYLFSFNAILCEEASHCTDLVVWGENLCSNVGGPQFTKVVSMMIAFPPHIEGILVGLLLSDGHLRICKGGKNAYLGLSQSTKHLSYLWFVFNLLSHYCKSLRFDRTILYVISSVLHWTGCGYRMLRLPHSLFYVNPVTLYK